MSPATRSLLTALGILAFSILGLMAIEPVELQGQSFSWFSPFSEQKTGSKAPIVKLETTSEGSYLKLHFVYFDFEDALHRFSCTIDKAAYDKEIASYGFPEDRETRWKQLDSLLQQEILARAGALSRFTKLRVEHEPVGQRDLDGERDERWISRLAEHRWNFSKASPQEVKSLTESANRLEAWFQDYWGERAIDVADHYFRDRGFVLDKTTAQSVRIDYLGLVDRAKDPLSDCYSALLRQAGARDESELAALLLAFLQGFQYSEPPESADGLVKAKFWTPLDVMFRKAGDCDSKGAAFCALWRGYPTKILLIEETPDEEDSDLANPRKTPRPSSNDPGAPTGHMILGIEAIPSGGQEFVNYGKRTFVLCEIAGPDRLSPGRRHVLEPLRRSPYRRYICVTGDCT